MTSVRTNAKKTGSSAPAALVEIVRLLSRQAAREWAKDAPKLTSRVRARNLGGAEMSANRAYLRAADIAEITGASVRTVRRWIADEILPSTKLGGARLVATADLESVLSGSSKRPEESPEQGEESDA